MSKRILQSALGIVGLILLVVGFLGLAYGVADDYYAIDIKSTIQGNIILDSNLRFSGGVWCGMGIILFWIIPSVEKQKVVFRSLCLMIFIGGIGRVLSMMTLGSPSALFILFTALEVFFPLLIPWQNTLIPTEK